MNIMNMNRLPEKRGKGPAVMLAADRVPPGRVFRDDQTFCAHASDQHASRVSEP
jgi:hypothetical protein